MRRRRQSVSALAALMACVCAAEAARAAEPTQTDERWYIVHLQDKHSGWMQEHIESSNDRITSTMRMQMAIRRGGTTLTTSVDSTFIETADGKAIEATARTKAADETLQKRIQFTPAGATITVTQGGRRQERQADPFDVQWLPPAAASRYVAERIEAGDREIRFVTIDPVAGVEPHRVTMRVLGPARVRINGQAVDATRVESESEAMPGVRTTDYLSGDGALLRSEIDLGGVAMSVELSDRATATAGVADVPELLASSLIMPDFSLLNPRKMTEARYRLSVAEGEMPDLESTAVQRVERINASALLVVIDLGAKPVDAGGEAPALRHSPMIDGTDPAIVDLARVATRGAGAKPDDRAEAMRRFVGRYIRHADLSVGFASASEVAKTRQGDCTEHAVLLAAILKADGIPARTASGLVYIEEFLEHQSVFGYHMWTQGWIGGRWVDLDATLDHRAFDAAHVTLSVSDLDDGPTDTDTGQIAMLLGRLRIELAD